MSVIMATKAGSGKPFICRADHLRKQDWLKLTALETLEGGMKIDAEVTVYRELWE